MTKEQSLELIVADYVSKLKQAQTFKDVEIAHATADYVLCDLLDTLGYEDVVLEWKKVRKWYA